LHQYFIQCDRLLIFALHYVNATALRSLLSQQTVEYLAKLQEHACRCLAKEYTASHTAAATSPTAVLQAAETATTDSTAAAAAAAAHTASTDSDAKVAAATAEAAAENSMHVASLHRAAVAAATPLTAACAADLMRLLQPTSHTAGTSTTTANSDTTPNGAANGSSRKASVAQKRKASVMDSNNSKGSRLSVAAAAAADTIAAAAATAAALDVLVIPLKEASLKALCGVAAWKLLAVAAKAGSVTEQEVSTLKIQVLWQVRTSTFYITGIVMISVVCHDCCSERAVMTLHWHREALFAMRSCAAAVV
jgi:hypothetical protein